MMLMLNSVARFGKIPTLWQNFKTLRQYFESLVSVGQNFKSTLANIFYYLSNFHWSKWPNIKQIIQPSGHTDAQDEGDGGTHRD